MKHFIALALALGAILVGTRAVYAAEKIRVANGGFGTAINAVLPAAYHEKLYQKYGIDAEYIALDSGTIGMQTLLANEIQILFTTGALAVTANLQGADTVIIAGGINFFPFKLVVRPGIKSAADLRGKRIAVSRFGSASDYAAQVALEKLGADPKQNTFLQLGANQPRLSALTSGAVDGSVFSEPFATLAVTQHGMRPLIDLAESGVPFPENCFVVKRSYLAEKRNVVVNALKASIEALYLMKRDKKLDGKGPRS